MFFTIALGASMAMANPASTELTVYNQGFALVKETRTLDLKEGRQNVAIENVASMIDPTSVAMKSLTDPSSLSILEQNYQYDLISPLAILNKSVGKRVTFIRTLGNVRDVLSGTLISSPTSVVGTAEGGNQQTYNGMVIRTDSGAIVLSPTGEIQVEQVPEGLISKPTLMWDLDSNKAGSNNVELSYITNGISWTANYVLTIDGIGHGDLKGWVTLNNNSGATYKDAKLKLLAGDVNTVQERSRVVRTMNAARLKSADAAPAFQEESLFEYHLYTLQRPATVRDRETKQVSLLEGAAVPVTKKIVIDSMRDYGQWYPTEGEVGTGDLHPQVRLEFVNDEKSNLGMPLPQGKFRIYQRDKSGSVQLLGEDQINHTPRNERLSLVVGRSFDIVSSRKRTEFRRLGTNHTTESYAIEVRNRKTTPETVFVMERHWADWKITTESLKGKKLDATTQQYELTLAPNEVKTIEYSVETKW